MDKTTGFNSQVISTLSGDVIFVSEPLTGHNHDMTVLGEAQTTEIIANACADYLENIIALSYNDSYGPCRKIIEGLLNKTLGKDRLVGLGYVRASALMIRGSVAGGIRPAHSDEVEFYKG